MRKPTLNEISAVEELIKVPLQLLADINKELLSFRGTSGLSKAKVMKDFKVLDDLFSLHEKYSKAYMEKIGLIEYFKAMSKKDTNLKKGSSETPIMQFVANPEMTNSAFRSLFSSMGWDMPKSVFEKEEESEKEVKIKVKIGKK